MPHTEIEFKIRMVDKNARDAFLKKIISLFPLHLKERRHLESDFVFSLNGDMMLRARYWQEFYANSTALNIKKIITLKLPRGKNRKEQENNEVEFFIENISNPALLLKLDENENYKLISKTLLENTSLNSLSQIVDWLFKLSIVKDISHFERAFATIFPDLKYSVRDKIRILYTTIFEGHEIEICFDELPTNENNPENSFFVEFSCTSHESCFNLQKFLNENMNITEFDKRGYGKIIKEEQLDFRFKKVK